MRCKKLFIQGARVVDPSANIDGEFDVLIEDGFIKAVGQQCVFDKRTDINTINASGKILVPGLCDIHTHLREPGFEWKETIQSGCETAISGGFTSLVCMPNTNPIIDNAQVVKFILDKGYEQNLCEIFPLGSISLGELGEQMSPMLELKEAGCVGFSDDGKPVMSALLLRKAMEYSLMLETTLALHEEDKELSNCGSMHEGLHSLKLGLKGIPGAAEDAIIARDIEIARLTGARVHICHLSSKRSVQLVKRAKEDGIKVTAEVTPHNLSFIDSDIGWFNTAFKMNPPLRSIEDREALLEGLVSGIIDCVASDHAPHDSDSKNKEFDQASFGVIGLQTTLPVMMELVRQKHITLKRAIAALTCDARKVFNLPSVKIVAGAKANLTLIDPHLNFTLNDYSNRSKSCNSPFWERSFQGSACLTIVNGQIAFEAAGEVEPQVANYR